jgi:nucleoside-diphosphate-sugar epimerase
MLFANITLKQASPIGVKSSNPDDHIKPAVNGTVGILTSILHHGPSVKRVVTTSSVMAILGKGKPNYTEEDWNDTAVQNVESLQDKATGTDLYSASKVLAERAAFKFVETNKDKIQWDLATVLPVYVSPHICPEW